MSKKFNISQQEKNRIINLYESKGLLTEKEVEGNWPWGMKLYDNLSKDYGDYQVTNANEIFGVNEYNARYVPSENLLTLSTTDTNKFSTRNSNSDKSMVIRFKNLDINDSNVPQKVKEFYKKANDGDITESDITDETQKKFFTYFIDDTLKNFRGTYFGGFVVNNNDIRIDNVRFERYDKERLERKYETDKINDFTFLSDNTIDIISFGDNNSSKENVGYNLVGDEIIFDIEKTETKSDDTNITSDNTTNSEENPDIKTENGNEISYGTLENDPSYNFYDSEWKYEGWLKNGKIDKVEPKEIENLNSKRLLSFGPSKIATSKITFSDGNFYVGDFEDGQIQGEGKFVFKSGLVLTGKFLPNEENEGGLTYSVTLNNGQTISDIFGYELKKNKYVNSGIPDWAIKILNTDYFDDRVKEDNCLSQLTNYVELIKKINNGEIKQEFVNLLSDKLKDYKKFIFNCYRTLPTSMRKRKQETITIQNPGGDTRQFAIVLENSNKRDIYNKNSMGLNNTISKVILEHKEKKNLKIQENKIIKNRLNFVLTENKDSILNLIKEKNILLNKGYDSELIEKNYNLIINKRFRNVGGE
jgi:hypothetical protein